MFTGIGGFELGIQRALDNKQLATIEQDRERRNRNTNEQPVLLCPTKDAPLCIGYSEIDKWSIQTYQKNFGMEARNYGDATKIKPEELPDFDMLCGGFPCQAFSIAGKRGGFEDTRGTLFFDIARILKVKRPKIVFLENVKGLLNHNKGETFRVIIQTLSELGYDVQWMVLNSKFFGVPQNRERVFIIGSLRGERRPEILPFRRTDTEINQEGIVHPTLTEAIGRQGCSKEYIRSCQTILDINQAQRVYSTEGKRQNGRRFKEDGEPSFTLTQQDKHGVFDGMQIRRLTPLECERLQGFPDNWTEGVSDTQRYKQCGNAVTVNVIEAIIKKIITSQKV